MSYRLRVSVPIAVKMTCLHVHVMSCPYPCFLAPSAIRNILEAQKWRQCLALLLEHIKRTETSFVTPLPPHSVSIDGQSSIVSSPFGIPCLTLWICECD